ncbi:MAG: 4Fe-4S binding protein [Magnetococcales bacterium]|nr:4Fe-4S binding protein [Magnetococcales bacterium]
MKRLGLPIFLLISVLLIGMAAAHAHGPGRLMRVETGYCAPESSGVLSREHWQIPVGETGASFCVRLRNLESFRVGVRLRFLSGFVSAEGGEICQMSDAREPIVQGHFFRMGANRCRMGSVVLEPGETQDIAGYWTRKPDRSKLNLHGDNDRVMVGCVLSEASALDPPERLHMGGMHIKRHRGMHMARVEGSGFAPDPPVVPENFDDQDPACDPLAKVLAERVVQAAVTTVASPSAVAPPMIHPGISPFWVWSGGGLLLLVALYGWTVPEPQVRGTREGVPLIRVAWIAPLVRFLTGSPGPLMFLKWISILLYGLVIVSGLGGTTTGGESWVTIFVWNLWWPLVILSVVVVGTAWCAICPWEALASLLVRGEMVQRTGNRDPGWFVVPRLLRNTYPALVLFLGLSWLEMGLNATNRPELTAWMAVLMGCLVVIALILFKRKAFCRYFCPVGRVLGLYARLSCMAIRPIDQAVCDGCATLTCYHGSENLPPCPTHLTVGRFSQNTHCLSCGSCLFSCPSRNVSWQWRPMASEAADSGRPSRDGAWFMLILLGMTLFHGLSMTPMWEEAVWWLSNRIGESGEPVVAFLLGMLVLVALPVPVYALAVVGSGWHDFSRRFCALAFATLPLAMAGHLSHNVTHLVRERTDVLAWLRDPWGGIVLPVCSVPQIPLDTVTGDEIILAAVRILLVVIGFHGSMVIVRHRQGNPEDPGVLGRVWRRLPMTLFGLVISAITIGLLASDMVMRF